MNIGHVMRILDAVETKLIRRAVRNASFDAAAGEPGTKSLRMMNTTLPNPARMAS